jgi:Zn-dependent protease with chaperone function
MLLAAEGFAQIAVAVILAVPAPFALARARWPARSPRAALVLWQAVGLSGGLAILGAGLTLAVSGLHRPWLSGVAVLPRYVLPGFVEPGSAVTGLGLLGWAGTALTIVAGAWLGYVLVASTSRLLLARREHRQRLDLLTDEVAVAGQPGAAIGDDWGEVRVRLLDHPLAAAYCLPGVRPRIVLSQGVIDVLSPDQLSAVVTHERAHARGRHDLVIQPFRAWQQAFPFLPAAAVALASVELLVEMLADDAARRRCRLAPLAQALRRLADDAPAGDRQVAARVDRLATSPVPLSRIATAAIWAAAVALVCLPPAILLAS